MKHFAAYTLVGWLLGLGTWGWSQDKNVTFTNSFGMKFALVPKGTFWMGGGNGKPGDRQVEITYDFFLGVYEVTQGQWQLIKGNNPSYFSRYGGGTLQIDEISDADLKQFPVGKVSWMEANQFLTELNALEKKKGWFYRLPTEAEWEYACRGGANTKEECSFDFYFDKPSLKLSLHQANFRDQDNLEQSLKRTTKVGSYKPNRLGIYDMHGNVAEWCDNSFSPKSVTMVFRGGFWNYSTDGCRAGRRYGGSGHNGFRIALIPDRGWGSRPKNDSPHIYTSYFGRKKADLCGDFSNKDLAKVIAENPDLFWLRVGFPGMDANSLKEIGKLKELSHLQVENSFWEREKGKLLTGGWKKLWRLRSLTVKDLEINEEAMLEIGTLEKLYKLELINCGLTNSRIKNTSWIENLRILSLTGAQLAEEGLIWIAGMEHLENLRLDQTGITNDDLKSLLPLKKLRYLDLRSTRVDDRGLKILAQIESLRSVVFLRKQVTTEGIQVIRKTNPMVEVILYPQGEK